MVDREWEIKNLVRTNDKKQKENTIWRKRKPQIIIFKYIPHTSTHTQIVLYINGIHIVNRKHKNKGNKILT